MASAQHRGAASADDAPVRSLWLLGERLCLDFANTIDPRHGDQPHEFLTSYADLAAWAGHAGALPEDEVTALLSAAHRDPAGAEASFRRAHRLRAQLYRVFSAIAAGQPPGAEALTGVNGMLAEAMGHARLVADGPDAVRWGWDERPSLDRPWWPVVRSAADVLTSGDHRRIRECPGLDGCGWLFYDTSRNGSRRWCSMEGCGNRAKGRRHYQRARQHRPG